MKNEKLKKELEKQIKEKLEKEKLEKEKKKDSELEMQEWKSDSHESDESDRSDSSDEESDKSVSSSESEDDDDDKTGGYKQSGGGSYDKMFEENKDKNTPFMILMENGINTEKEKNFIMKIIGETSIQLDQENINGYNIYDILNDNIISLIDENYDINTDNKEIKELVDSFAELCQQNTEEE